MITITYGANGADHFIDNGYADDWEVETTGPYVRTYQSYNRDITLVGDFGSQTSQLADDTTIFMIDYLNSQTGVGMKISGISVTWGVLREITEIEELYEANSSFKVTGSSVADDIYGGTGKDQLFGLGGADTIYGDSGNDVIDGGSDSDLVTGSLGADRLTGGEGVDFFVYYGQEESMRGAKSDVVTDFVSGVDVFELKNADANENTSKNNAFIWIGEKDFTRVGQLRFEQTYDGNHEAITLVQSCTNRNGRVDFEIELVGHIDLAKADFIL